MVIEKYIIKVIKKEILKKQLLSLSRHRFNHVSLSVKAKL